MRLFPGGEITDKFEIEEPSDSEFTSINMARHLASRFWQSKVFWRRKSLLASGWILKSGLKC